MQTDDRHLLNRSMHLLWSDSKRCATGDLFNTRTNVICPARAGFPLGAAPLRLLQQLRNSAAAVLVSASCWLADTQFNLTALDCSSSSMDIKALNRSKIKSIIVILLVAISISFESFGQKKMFL